MPRPKIVVLFLCRALGLFRLARWATRKRLGILCYHGFELQDETKFRPKLFMTRAQFEQRLATIQRCGYTVLPLDEAVDRLYAGTLPANALAITVDDGFHSFYRLAVPVLQAYGYAATVYVTSYYVQKGNPVFRLVVQYMFWKTAGKRLLAVPLPWSSLREVDLADPAQALRMCWDCIAYGERACTEEMRCALCVQLGVWLQVPYAGIVDTKILSLMAPHEIQSLAARRIDVQLHTHRHVFPSQDRASAEREIADNRAALQAWLPGQSAGHFAHFCYPSGQWNPAQWAWLDALQVKSATTCLAGQNTRRTPPHALRRFLDGQHIHPLEFEAALSGFSGGLRGLLGRS